MPARSATPGIASRPWRRERTSRRSTSCSNGARQARPLALKPLDIPRGASSLGSDARQDLRDHPTVKPTAMLEDAFLDLTRRGDVVLDPFLGSGSTLLAAHKTGRVCRGLELDPLYVDVAIRRFEATTGLIAKLVETGEEFGEVVKRRASDVQDSARGSTSIDSSGRSARAREA
jgi:DNA modification methylase